MAAKSLPSQERLRQLFSYNPDTGVLAWRERPESDFPNAGLCRLWNRRFAGKPAGTKLSKDGSPREVSVRIYQRSFGAHRLIWIMVNGAIPEGKEIDHINLNPWDNRLDNLRPATHAQNLWNQRARSRTGFKGVQPCGARFQARISANRKQQHLGVFATVEEAAEAYLRAAKLLHGDFARTG